MLISLFCGENFSKSSALLSSSYEANKGILAALLLKFSAFVSSR